MELEVTKVIYIDIDTIIENYELTEKLSVIEIYNAIEDNILGFDDNEFYILEHEEYLKIFGEILKKLLTD